MNEHEIMNSELDNETLPEMVNDETSGTANVVTTVAKTIVCALATWKGVELIVHGFTKLRNHFRSKKQAKEVPSDKVDDEIEVPEVDEHQFD